MDHVRPVDLLQRPSWVMTEQVRTIARQRTHGVIGQVDADCLAQCRSWLDLFADVTVR
ncbi:MAG: type II toxin-antitoxin system PemK/MazF family toxin [Propionibacteriaceae bacterium]|nr:type II toxin-antitoxin system PemK/MazF family toxin [Propionibacteriaceae bacterium]